jgi:hypothetical protein
MVVDSQGGWCRPFFPGVRQVTLQLSCGAGFRPPGQAGAEQRSASYWQHSVAECQLCVGFSSAAGSSWRAAFIKTRNA